MILQIIFLVLFCLAVGGGVFYLRSSPKIPETTKINVLLIVGALLCVSLIISAFKQRRYITFSLFKADINSAERAFTTMPFKYQHKLKPLEKLGLQSKDFYLSNYQHYGAPPKDYNEKIIFISQKYHGASKFMYDVAEDLQRRGHPALYAKYQYPVDSEYELAQSLGMPTFKALEDSIEAWNRKNLKPYILIDGLQQVCRNYQFMLLLKRLFETNKVNFIGNAESPDVVERIFSLVDDREILVRHWQPPSKQFLSSASSNSFFKKLPPDFKTLSSLQQASEEEILMKRATAAREMANFFQVDDVMKKLSGQRNMRVSALRNTVDFDDLKRLEQLGLIRINNGVVQLLDGSFYNRN